MGELLALVFGAAAHVEGADHAELVVEFLRRVRVDGEGAARGLDVHADEGGGAVADDGDGGGGGELEEGGGGYRCREGADVFLAVLRLMSILKLREGEEGDGNGEDLHHRRNAV